MTDHDPSIEAAQRAWAERYPYSSTGLTESVLEDGIGAFVVASARAALKPIRELAEELRATHLHQVVSDEARERYLGVEYVLGKLVPLIYSSEELAQ